MRRFSLRLAPRLLLVPSLLIAGSVAAQTPDQPMPAPVPPAITPQAPATPIPAPTPAPATKETAIEQAPLNPPEVQSVDQMLSQLKRERDPDAARVIANSTMAAWSESNSPTIDLLMQWSAKAAADKRNAAALDFIDQAITLKPDFVGAWNQRATLHFTMGNYKKSVSDIEKVLELEPRHFGAIAGLAGILTERGSKDAALKAWERYLDIYPADREAQEIVAKLSEELAGQKT